LRRDFRHNEQEYRRCLHTIGVGRGTAGCNQRDTLTKSLTDGIPAEIEARRAQYGYYRYRLLDFPRKAGATRSMFCILDIGSMST